MICIKNGKLVTPAGICEKDLYIQNEKIFSVGGYWANAEVFDAGGRFVFPGFVDGAAFMGADALHRPTEGGIAAASECALLGGFTSVMNCVTQKRSSSLLQALEGASGTKSRASCDYGVHLGISEWNDRVAQELERFPKAGITSFLAYMSIEELRMEDEAILSLLRAASKIGFVGIHCELGATVKRGVTARLSGGDKRVAYHTLTRPNKVEAGAVKRALELAAEAEVPVWIRHISAAESLEEIRKARARGQFVLAETCPQYLTLTSEKLLTAQEESSKYVCIPPLRSAADTDALWRAVAAGEIQMISSDHCAFSAEEKNAGADIDFAHIPAGVPSLSSLASLLWTEGVEKSRIRVTDFCRLLSENPAKVFGLYPRKGAIRTGADADLVIWDAELRSTITAEGSRTSYSAWEGRETIGAPSAVFLRGTLSVCNGEIVSSGRGEYLPRECAFA